MLGSVSTSRHVDSKRYEPKQCVCSMWDTHFHSLKDFVDTKVPTTASIPTPDMRQA